MNGVHCQISAISTDSRGAEEIQSGCGASPEPNSRQSPVRVPFSSPYSGLNKACFQTSAAATGTIRKGAIIMVRTAPRPANRRSSSSAMPSPSSRLTSTTTTVSSMVVITDARTFSSVKTRR